MGKRLAALLLLMLFVMSFTACGGKFSAYYHDFTYEEFVELFSDAMLFPTYFPPGLDFRADENASYFSGYIYHFWEGSWKKMFDDTIYKSDIYNYIDLDISIYIQDNQPVERYKLYYFSLIFRNNEPKYDIQDQGSKMVSRRRSKQYEHMGHTLRKYSINLGGDRYQYLIGYIFYDYEKEYAFDFAFVVADEFLRDQQVIDEMEAYCLEEAVKMFESLTPFEDAGYPESLPQGN